MTRAWLVLVATAAGACGPTADVAITHVSVVDVATGAIQPDQSVLLAGRHILTVGPAASLSIPSGAKVIDGQGKYLIPGLWDMHVHTVSRDIDFALEVANGVTGIRDMGGSQQYPPPGNWGIAFDSLRDWRARIRSGELIGPRIVAGGVALDGPQPFWPQPLSLQTPAQARAVVDSLRKEGVDFVKVYLQLPSEILLAIADQAGKVGLTFAGHPSQFVPMVNSAAAGQRSFEHADAFEVAYFDSLTLRAFMNRGSRPPFPQEERAEFMTRVLRSYDGSGLDSVGAQLKRYGAWLDPTLVTMRSLACIAAPDSTRALFELYVPAHVRAVWEARISGRCGPQTNHLHAERWEHQRAALRQMHRVSVDFLVGSDAWNAYVLPGSSLHEELEMLVANGMTPLEALRAATLGAARFLRVTDSLGAVAERMVADLVLLDANPLEDIANTRRIAAVVLNGRLLERPALDSLLASARSRVAP